MQLSDLVGQNFPNASIEIVGIACDSREVLPGFLFAALPGTNTSGKNYIEDAIDRGAVVILADGDTKITNSRVLVINDDNPRRKLSLIAARFFDRQPEWLAAVTGTNGKTSVANFALQMWSNLGVDGAALGTLGIKSPDGCTGLTLTTPDPVTLHQELRNIADAGVTHAVLEASSHGLDQNRLDGVSVQAGAFTNLTHDHLDYHGSINSYLAAKRRLFSEIVLPGGTAVLNRDCSQYDDLVAVSTRREISILSYGYHPEEYLRLLSTKVCGSGQEIVVRINEKEHSLLLPLYGSFQSINALCALGLVVASGVPSEIAAKALGHLHGVRGRLDLVVELPNRAKVFVYYAHTPAALNHTLAALRDHTKGRLVTVFGCGGDRDTTKRPEMGKVAAELADQIFVTDDNPRSENPRKIREAILEGCPRAIEVDDRRKAIERAISDLHAGDILVVAGKGHETGQIIGSTSKPFDDLVEVRRAAASQKRVAF